NTEWVRLPNVKIILCGSAASWMLDKLINAKGGLHNRITRILLIEPFDLGNTKTFLHQRGIKLSNKSILDLYLAMGGIPYYLNQIKPGKSVIQNINDICFR